MIKKYKYGPILADVEDLGPAIDPEDGREKQKYRVTLKKGKYKFSEEVIADIDPKEWDLLSAELIYELVEIYESREARVWAMLMLPNKYEAVKKFGSALSAAADEAAGNIAEEGQDWQPSEGYEDPWR